MDSREVLVIVLERLRTIEKNHREQMASLKALLSVLCTGNPDFLKRYRNQKELADEQSTRHPVSIDTQYDELLELLKNPGPPEEDEQERLHRLLESFEGPKQ